MGHHEFPLPAGAASTARKLFKTINQWQSEAGGMMTQGTLVDATIIEAPSSTKNKQQQREELAKVKVD